MQMGPTRRSTPLSPARGLPEGSAWRPVSLPWAMRSEDRLPRALSPALAPASGSFGWWVRGPKIPRSPSVGSETGHSVVVFRRWRRIPGRSLEALPDERPGLADRWQRCFAFLFKAIGLLRTGVLCKAIWKTARTVAAITIGFEFSRSFSLLGLSDPSFSLPLDGLKVPLGPESGKRARPGFSTFHGFCCGHGWISQPLVADHSGKAWRFNGLAGREAATARRSV